MAHYAIGIVGVGLFYFGLLIVAYPYLLWNLFGISLLHEININNYGYVAIMIGYILFFIACSDFIHDDEMIIQRITIALFIICYMYMIRKTRLFTLVFGWIFI